MQIDLVKYYITNSKFIQELKKVLNTEIPEGYIEVNATTHQSFSQDRT